MITLRERRRRLAPTSNLPIFVSGLIAGAVGHPFAQPIILGPQNVKRNNSFALVFTSAVNNADAYSQSDVPSGGGWATLSATGNAGMAVFSKVIPFGQFLTDITWGGGLGDIWVGLTSAAIFYTGTHTLIQSQFGGAPPFGVGTNAFNIASPTTEGNTVVVAIQVASTGGVPNEVVINNVRDDKGNKYIALTEITEVSPPLDFNQAFQMWTFYCRGVKGGATVLSFDLEGVAPASGSPWLGEFQLH